jgi:hypothetical protein
MSKLCRAGVVLLSITLFASSGLAVPQGRGQGKGQGKGQAKGQAKGAGRGAAKKLASKGQRPLAEKAPHKRSERAVAGLAALGRKARGRLDVTWGKRGKPRAVYGKLGRYGAPSEASARAFLADNPDLFELRPDLADLTPGKARRSAAGGHFEFEQKYKGLKVHGAKISVTVDEGGEVTVAGGEYFDGIELDDVTPRVGADEARSALAAATGGAADAAPEASELVVYVDEGEVAHLAYRVVQPTTDADGEAETFEGFVDAVSGRVVDEPHDVNQYATAKVFRNGNAMAATGDPSIRDASVLPASAYTTVTLNGLTSQTALVGAYVDTATYTQIAYRAAPDAAGNYMFDRSTDPAAGAKFDAAMIYYYVDFAQRYIQQLGFSSLDNRPVAFNVGGTTADVSFYIPDGFGTGRIVVGTGGVDDAEDAETVLHEYGHSLQDNAKPEIWRTAGTAGVEARTGAMGEGFGDYWACSVMAQHFQQAGTPYETAVMEWDSTDFSTSSPPTIRSITSTKHYPESVTGEVHDDGEMWSSTLW